MTLKYFEHLVGKHWTLIRVPWNFRNYSINILHRLINLRSCQTVPRLNRATRPGARKSNVFVKGYRPNGAISLSCKAPYQPSNRSNRPRLPAAQSFEGFVATSPAVTTRAVQTEPLRATTATAPTMPDTAVPIGRETKVPKLHIWNTYESNTSFIEGSLEV